MRGATPNDPALLPAVLSRYWGYSDFRPLQREAMEAILAGRDSVVVLPTGGGKSLCFQAPALVKAGVGVVVSPLISLMKDQVDALTANGVPAACYNSALSAGQKAETIAGIRAGRFRLIYVSPERLAGAGGESFRAMVPDVAFIAIDEAHCISQWGHDFRPEYRQLGMLRDWWPGVSVHAFTATATGRVRRDIVAQLGLREPLELVGGFDRPNLVYRVVPRGNLKRQLTDVLQRREGQAGIIYCTSRREVDALAAWLSVLGVRALPYHAGLDDEKRHRNQDAFTNEEIDIVVATVAFGMGIDRSDVRFVVHAGMPQSLEHYQQESGRAGRDGLEAECVLIYSAADVTRWRVMLDRAGELSDARQRLLRDMTRYAAGVGCRHRALVTYFGEPYGGGACDACDYCLGELEAIEDAATTARKVLSCVARVGQRFGAAHVANVLCGSDSETVRARRHERLSTFGLLREAPLAEVRGYIEQLVAAGLLQQADQPLPVLVITPRGLELLKDAGAAPDLRLARQRRPTRERPQKRARPEADSWTGVDRALFDRLRALRMQVARERGVPPYVIFHDATLREMASLKPRSAAALLGVYGVGARKADELGARFLEAIEAHLSE